MPCSTCTFPFESTIQIDRRIGARKGIRFGQRALSLERFRFRLRVQAQPLELALRKVLDQLLALLVRDFERPRKPQIQRPVHQRVAEEKQKHHGQQRNAHRAHHHLYFEARAQLSAAPLGPEPHQASRQNQSEDQKRGGNKRR